MRTGQTHSVRRWVAASANEGGGSVMDTSPPSQTEMAACADPSEKRCATSASGASTDAVLRTVTVPLCADEDGPNALRAALGRGLCQRGRRVSHGHQSPFADRDGGVRGSERKALCDLGIRRIY